MSRGVRSWATLAERLGQIELAWHRWPVAGVTLVLLLGLVFWLLAARQG